MMCDLLPFYNKIVPHCQGYYVFVPPLSTLCSGLIMGTWFSDLTKGIKSKCLFHFSALLLAALHQKSTGLVGHSSFDYLLLLALTMDILHSISLHNLVDTLFLILF